MEFGYSLLGRVTAQATLLGRTDASVITSQKQNKANYRVLRMPYVQGAHKGRHPIDDWSLYQLLFVVGIPQPRSSRKMD